MDAISTQRFVRPPGRLAFAALAAALVVSAVALILVWDAAWWPVVVFALAPDLAVLYGIAPGLARGQLHPQAVPLYNALHRFWGPLAFAVVVLASGLPHLCRGGARLGGPRRVRPRDRSAAADTDGFQRGDNA